MTTTTTTLIAAIDRLLGVKPLYILLSLFAVTLAISIGFPTIFYDEVQYWALAENLANEGVMGVDAARPSAHRPPLVPLLATPVHWLGGSIYIAKAAFTGFYLLAGYLLLRFTRDAFPGPNGVVTVSLLLLLGNPSFVFSAGTLYPQAVQVPVYLLLFFLVFGQIEALATPIRTGVAIGLCSGLLLLASASAVFSLLPIYLYLAYRALGEIARDKARLWLVICASVTAVLVIAPSIVRNHMSVHSGVYISLNAGENLLLGNSPNTGPNTGVGVDLSAYRTPVFFELDEYERDRALLDAALDNIRSAPGYYALLYLKKFANGFNNNASTVTYGTNVKKSAVLWLYYLLLIAGVVVLIACVRARSSLVDEVIPESSRAVYWTWAKLIGVCYVMNIAGFAIFFTRLRFRIPLDAVLVLVSMVGWAIVVAWLRRRAQAPARAASA